MHCVLMFGRKTRVIFPIIYHRRRAVCVNLSGVTGNRHGFHALSTTVRFCPEFSLVHYAICVSCSHVAMTSCARQIKSLPGVQLVRAQREKRRREELGARSSRCASPLFFVCHFSLRLSSVVFEFFVLLCLISGKICLA